ncbi:MAG TPA: acyl-CoA dehydrogenase family protein [Stellaceae bacterium]|nr:acyl-CoA dehydrogenase family protein [Stellaceae bacterium]
MTEIFRFDPLTLPPVCDILRREVRAFLAEERSAGRWRPGGDFTSGHSPDFSRRLGARGWIGMTWPKRYGGQERSFLERYVVTEELLAAGAPVGAHWVADRQSGPLLLRFASETLRQEILPRITAGECFFCIGMSEPDSGSDLASIRTKAAPVEGGWLLNGRKIWTSNAHKTHFMIALCRTGPVVEKDRHQGLSQLVVDLKAPGISIRPIKNLAGAEHFNEVLFEDVFIPGDRMIGQPGDGWKQVTSELGYERSGPERFLSTFRLLVEFLRRIGPTPDERSAEAIGRIVAHVATLRRMSLSVAGMLQKGETVNLEAAVVKDLGTNLEKEIPELVRLVARRGRSPNHADLMEEALAAGVLNAPSFTLRGGTREILRGIVARGLGLR